MPIKGVSELRRLPRLGKIRLGVKRTSAKTGGLYPDAMDFFVVPEDIKRFLGDMPRSLDILFPIEDKSKSVDEQPFFPQWLKSWGSGSGLKCKGNGVTAHRVQPGGGFVEVECDPESCPEFQAKPYPQCGRNANLQFMIPKIPGAGIWQIDTGSFHSILQVNSALELIRSIAGRLSLVPLRLVLEPKEVAPDGKKKTVFVLNLRYDGTVQDLAAIAGRAPSTMFALPAVDDSVPPDDITDPDTVATYSDALAAKESEEARVRAEVLAAPVPQVVTEEAGPTDSPHPTEPPRSSESGPASPSTLDTIDVRFTTVEQAPPGPPSPPKPPGPPSLTPPPPNSRVFEDIEAFMNELNLSSDQRAEYRRKHPDARLLVAVLRTEATARRAAANRGSQSGQGKGVGQGGQGRLVG